jgi:hypothetical protein
MFFKKVRGQIGNLTYDHQKLGIALIYLRIGGMMHIIRKLLTKANNLLQLCYNFALNLTSIEGLHKKL